MSKEEINNHAKTLPTIRPSRDGKSGDAVLAEQEQQTIARQAAQSKWGEMVPRASYQGKLVLKVA